MSGKTKCAKMCGWLFSRLFVVALSSFRVACNGQVLLQVGYFIMSSPELLPIENMKLKSTTKSQIDIRLPEQKYSDANS